MWNMYKSIQGATRIHLQKHYFLHTAYAHFFLTLTLHFELQYLGEELGT
jgi:small basic protein